MFLGALRFIKNVFLGALFIIFGIFRGTGEKLGFGLRFEGGGRATECVRRLFIQVRLILLVHVCHIWGGLDFHTGEIGFSDSHIFGWLNFCFFGPLLTIFFMDFVCQNLKMNLLNFLVGCP